MIYLTSPAGTMSLQEPVASLSSSDMSSRIAELQARIQAQLGGGVSLLGEKKSTYCMSYYFLE